jgi:hypothetical protein
MFGSSTHLPHEEAAGSHTNKATQPSTENQILSETEIIK